MSKTRLASVTLIAILALGCCAAAAPAKTTLRLTEDGAPVPSGGPVEVDITLHFGFGGYCTIESEGILAGNEGHTDKLGSLHTFHQGCQRGSTGPLEYPGIGGSGLKKVAMSATGKGTFHLSDVLTFHINNGPDCGDVSLKKLAGLFSTSGQAVTTGSYELHYPNGGCGEETEVNFSNAIFSGFGESPLLGTELLQ